MKTMELVASTGSTAEMMVAVNQAREYAAHARAENTVRAYRNDWAHFTAWCQVAGAVALPAGPVTVAAYIGAMAQDGFKVATITRRLAAISKAHQVAGHDSPATMRHAPVAETLAGIKREHGVAQIGKTALVTVDMRQLVGTLNANTLIGKRDAALLLVGFAGAFRRSELAALTVEDLEFNIDGLKVNIQRSKTDQTGAGQLVGIPYGSNPATCPVRTLKSWLESAGITTGPVFRAVAKGGRVEPHAITDQVVRLVVVRTCTAANLDPAKYAAHSLRSGFVTQACMSGASDLSIRQQTRHKTLEMVARYRKVVSLFTDNAATKLGL